MNWNGSRLRLEAVAPKPGYAADVDEHSSTRIRVEFERDDDDSRIEVRVENGQIRVDID